MSAALDRLDRALVRQRTALIRADFKALESITAEVQRAMSGLSAAPHDRARFERMTRMAGENAGLIRAAQRGLARARQLVGRGTAASGLTTYGASGARDTASAPRPSVQRRV